MTKRLRELEAKESKYADYKFQYSTTAQGARARAEGYRMALEDLRPVLEAAQESVEYFATLAAIPDAGYKLEHTLAEVQDAERRSPD